MKKILIADEIDLSGLKKLPKGKFFIKTEFGISNHQIIKEYKNFDVLVIRSIRKIDRKFMEEVSFKIIATCSKGTDHIDEEYAGEKGITIFNADDSNNISAAEHTVALMLAASKKINFSDKLVRENRFNYYNYERTELNARKAGIIGFGKVGSYVGNLCEAFGMKVYANDIDKKVKIKNKNFEFRSLDFIFRYCDFISIHIPLSKENFKFISQDKLKKINREAILINTSRGAVIDEKYLLRMLKDKKIKYAGLDVFCSEPNISREFGKLDNVILTNHIAGKTIESRRRVSENIFMQIKNYYG